MTEETRLKLIEYTAKEIERKSKSLDQTKKQLDLLEKLKRIGLTSEELADIFKILEFKILIGFVSLDLTTAVRSYLKAEFQYEGLYFLRQFTVVINEGYKKVYNFNKIDANGNEEIGNRAKSLWINLIARIIDKRDNENLSKKYSELTNKLDNYLNQNFEGIKEIRDISIHYDSNPMKVYDTFTELEPNKLIKNNFVPFYELLDSIFVFAHEILLTYNINNLK